MIVDTSIWIDFLHDVRNAKTDLVAEEVVKIDSVFITPTILQEVLQGVYGDHLFARVKESLLSCPILRLDPVEAAIEAAQLYRSLRKKGVTIRKPNDCLIAHYAIFYDMPILHNDADFDRIAQFSALRIAKA